jgi:hypothetical protein
MRNTVSTTLYLEETTVRLVAAQVVLFSVIIIISGWYFLALGLSLDFAIRAFSSWPSPLAIIAKFLRNQLSVQPVPVFAPPKKFAAGVGFIFSMTYLLLFYFDFTFAAYATGAVLVFCALLESVFKICVGCYVFDWVVAPFLNKKETDSQ